MNEMEIILSLDMSTKSTGWCIFKNNELYKYGKIIISKNTEWHERISIMGIEIQALIDEFRPDKVIAEDVPLEKQRGMKTLGQLYSLHGILTYVCSLSKVQLEFIPVSTWRRLVGLYDGTNEGKKRAVLKKHSIEKVNELFNLELNWVSDNSLKNDDDISDAILLVCSTFVDKKVNTMSIGRKAKR